MRGTLGIYPLYWCFAVHESQDRGAPVSGLTGFWFHPGFLLLGIGPLVWWIKTDGALDDCWRSVGARSPGARPGGGAPAPGSAAPNACGTVGWTFSSTVR